MEKVQKKQYPSPAQKARLIAILDNDKELRQGKFSATFTKKVAEKRWISIASEINSIPGAMKQWFEWRKTWQDMKTKSKKKQSILNRQQNMTGGGPPPPPLSEEVCLVLSSISKAALSGHSDSFESVVRFSDLERSSTKEIIQPAPAAAATAIEINSCDIEILETPPNPPSQILDFDRILSVDLEEEQENIFKEKAKKTMASDRIISVDLEEEKEDVIITKKPKRTVAQKRLQKSIDAATALQKAVEEKNLYKKAFCENYIIEMKKQTEAFWAIANNLKRSP